MIDTFKGLAYIPKGLSLITHKGIRPFVVIPLLINILLFSLATWLAIANLEPWIAYLLPSSSWLHWLSWILWPILVVVVFLASFYSVSILANIIAAPFNSILAERVEAHLRGQAIVPQDYSKLPMIIVRTFRSEISKLLYLGLWALGIFLITLLPVINVIAPVMWLWFGSWMLAIEYIDYPMGNHNLYFKQELAALRKHRLASLGFGGGMSVLVLIPIVNFFRHADWGRSGNCPLG